MARRYRYHPALTTEEENRIVELVRSGLTVRKTATIVGVSPSTVSAITQRHGVNRPRGGANRVTEVHIIVDGRSRHFRSKREAAKALGVINYNRFQWLLKKGHWKAYDPKKYREHPGLDCIPTPYPFQSKSREILEHCGPRGPYKNKNKNNEQ